MSVRVAIHHRTEYHYDRLVSLSPHTVRLRPAPHTRTPMHHFSLKVEPDTHFLNWQQDPFGNFIARYVFPEKTKRLIVDVNLVVDLVTINPFDFFVEDDAAHYPFQYESQLAKELTPYFEIKESGPLLNQLLDKIKQADLGKAMTLADAQRETAESGEEPEPYTGPHIVHFLVELNQHLEKLIGYTIRLEPGIQSCEKTLHCKTGSCRDSGWLLVQILRHLGLAARFVSGYLIQLTADQKSLDGPSGPEVDFTDLHAWAEVFIPGAGWIGLDPTSGLFAGEGHIPLACTPDPTSAAPISGATDKCEVTFKFENKVSRIHEDPRVTKPYTEDQWRAILALGDQVDQTLLAGDVRLTMGGEPTFVSIDDMDSPQWNTAALGEHKLERAGVLLRKLKQAFGSDALLHYGQGKWYPGEQLPRWAMTCAWRKDGQPVWQHPELLDHPDSSKQHSIEHARALIECIAEQLALDNRYIRPGFEDGAYYLWKEGTLPSNVDVTDNKLKDPIERERIRRIFEQGLDAEVGFALPIAWDYGSESWISSTWTFRRGKLFLIPGDSPMGYRLPLDSLLWEPEQQRQQILPKDPFDARRLLPQIRDRLRMVHRGVTLPLAEPPMTADDRSVDRQGKAASGMTPLIRTTLCLEPRNGHLHVFLPPLEELEHYLDLVNAIETAAVETNLPIVMEGYEPPHDPRLQRLMVTPDPGVIEVNIHPAHDWQELVQNTSVLYEEARQARLGTEKFMLDGRHSGTGGGNHVTIGGPSPADSPILRRPHLLRSLLTYWQNHPALSYLFSGLFIGPTSQAPRVDEARDDALYELGIAFKELPPDETPMPWVVDRVLRHLLVDLTGNTHRSEFCIDKLYSPDGPNGRLGLVEFRGFEMPPHAQMSSVQMLLLRSLIARFWDRSYEREPVRWGTELHDRFMLPHHVERDLADVIEDLRQAGHAFDQHWFDPFIEFRFPRYGTLNVNDIELELRFAIEPWNVLGEEVTTQGTARFVDSSVERLQVKAEGLTPGRHVIACNGRRVPLRNTGTRGEFVAGVRYKAWQPPSGLHPTIPAQTPLVFDVVDTWNERSLGGCTYHVAHPGGRSHETFPVNAYEAEARRLARFAQHGHSGGCIQAAAEPLNPDFPWTLDLRTPVSGEEL
ncbi:MAG: transglutaminase family protein [Gammaproteobacteria bacterium]|nr:transglutaminase family protein [Gammaproteobacteria bacterium]